MDGAARREIIFRRAGCLAVRPLAVDGFGDRLCNSLHCEFGLNPFDPNAAHVRTLQLVIQPAGERVERDVWPQRDDDRNQGQGIVVTFRHAPNR